MKKNKKPYALKNIKKSREGFTIIELMFSIVLLGFLITLIMPRFSGYKADSNTISIQTDIAVLEGSLMKDLISDGSNFKSWGGTSRDFNLVIENKKLYDIGGLVKESNVNNYENMRIVEDEFLLSKRIDTSGTFYANNEGSIYYEHEKIKSDIEIKENGTEGNDEANICCFAGNPEIDNEVDDDNKTDIEENDKEENDEIEDVIVDIETINYLVKEKGYIPVSSGEELANIGNNKTNKFGKNTSWENNYKGELKRNYVQVTDIDMSQVKNFEGIGSSKNKFTGTYNGNNLSIRNLSIKNSKTNYVGLFGYIKESTIENLNLKNFKIEGKNYTGGLVGYSEDSKISKVTLVGSIKGEKSVGGLIGVSKESTVTDSHANGDILGKGSVGGLLGNNDEGKLYSSSFQGTVISESDNAGGLIGKDKEGRVHDSTIKGSVSSPKNTGCLVGYNKEIRVTNVFSNCDAFGSENVGGLVGYNNEGTINNSYNAGIITGTKNIGGLVGINYEGKLRNTYSLSSLYGSEAVGGLVGRDKEGSIRNSYSSGRVTGNKYVEALVGRSSETSVRYSYYNKDIATMSTKGEGLTESEMKNKSKYKDWDFNEIWTLPKGSFPTLRSN